MDAAGVFCTDAGADAVPLSVVMAENAHRDGKHRGLNAVSLPCEAEEKCYLQ